MQPKINLVRTSHLRVLIVHFARLAGLISMGVLVSCAARLHDTNLALHLHPGEQVPAGFKSYSFFLTTTDWAATDADLKKVTVLEKQFKEFADAIGDDNLAMWVSGPDGRLSVSLGRYYSDLFSAWSGQSIEYNSGPYVILTGKHPSNLNSSANQSIVVIDLKGLSPENSQKVLNNVEMAIRRGKISTRQITFDLFCTKLMEWWDNSSNAKFVKEAAIKLITKKLGS